MKSILKLIDWLKRFSSVHFCQTSLDMPVVCQPVDLGLSVKWASVNIGAKSPAEHGAYFAWGETKPKKEYSYSTYKYCKQVNDSVFFTKYNTGINKDISSQEQENGIAVTGIEERKIEGNVDGKLRLDLCDDAAYINWGQNWRLPSKEDWIELHNNCDWISNVCEGIKGYEVVSRINKQKIFIPSAGTDTKLNDALMYWSSDLCDTASCNAWVYCPVGHISWFGKCREIGLPIRPVCIC